MSKAPDAVVLLDPLWLTLFPLIALFLYLVVRRTRKFLGRNRHHHWRIDPALPAGIRIHHDANTPIHHWEPRYKIFALVCYLFTVGSLQSLGPAFIAIGFSLLLVLIARTPAGLIVHRLAAVSGVFVFFFLVMPLTAVDHPGDPLVALGVLPGLVFNLRGLLVALLAYTKATAIVLMTLPLFSTQRPEATAGALERLGVPNRLLQLALFFLRYVHVLGHESQRMATAMESRGFGRGSWWRTAGGIGNFVGLLLIRSLERTQRVVEAMASRGYTGRLQFEAPTKAGWPDLLKGLVVGCVCLGLIALDRLTF